MVGIAVTKSNHDHLYDRKNFHKEKAEDQVLTSRYYMLEVWCLSEGNVTVIQHCLLGMSKTKGPFQF